MKRRQQTTKQRENVSRLGLESDLRGPLGLWVAPINLANDHQLGHMFEEKEGRKKTFWHLGYWKQWMISDQVWRLERGFSQTQHNGNISANDQPWCQKLKTVEPTIQRDPPPPPPPYLNWRKHTFSSPGLSALATGHPYPSHYNNLTLPLFPVSFLVWKLSKIRALVLVTITLLSIYIYIFSFRLQKCQSLFLVARDRL